MIRRIRRWLGLDLLEELQHLDESYKWAIRIIRGDLNRPEVYEEYMQWLDRVNTTHQKK